MNTQPPREIGPWTNIGRDLAIMACIVCIVFVPIFLPGFFLSRHTARQMKCGSQVRSIQAGFVAWAQHDDRRAPNNIDPRDSRGEP